MAVKTPRKRKPAKKSSLPGIVVVIIAATTVGAVGGAIIGAHWLMPSGKAPGPVASAPITAAPPIPAPPPKPEPPPVPSQAAPTAASQAAAKPLAPPAAPPPPRDPNSPPNPIPVPAPADIAIAALPPLPAPPLAAQPTVPAPAAPSAPVTTGLPAWRRYAVAANIPSGRPMIAIIIDDMGVDRRRSAEAAQLPGLLTMAYMAYAADPAEQISIARAHGDEIMMHIPMQPQSKAADPGPNALLVNLSPDEIKQRFDKDLAAFTGYVGIDNHEGSLFTENAVGMRVVMDELKRRGLLFVDARTTAKSVGLALARQAGVPAAGRDIFLDDQPDIASVRRQLVLVEQQAKKHGTVIAIGHPKDGTIAALAAWLPTLAAKGFALAPASAVVAVRMGSGTSAIAPVAATNAQR